MYFLSEAIRLICCFPCRIQQFSAWLQVNFVVTLHEFDTFFPQITEYNVKIITLCITTSLLFKAVSICSVVSFIGIKERQKNISN